MTNVSSHPVETFHHTRSRHSLHLDESLITPWWITHHGVTNVSSGCDEWFIKAWLNSTPTVTKHPTPFSVPRPWKDRRIRSFRSSLAYGNNWVHPLPSNELRLCCLAPQTWTSESASVLYLCLLLMRIHFSARHYAFLTPWLYYCNYSVIITASVISC